MGKTRDDDPDETKGRRMYRLQANYKMQRDEALARRGVRMTEEPKDRDVGCA